MRSFFDAGKRCGGMANEKNLKPFTSEQSHEEAVKNGRKGGLATGKKKKKAADLREALQAALVGNYKTEDGKTLSGAELLVLAMMQIASDPKNRGSAVAAFNALAKMLGQDVPETDKHDDDQVRKFLDALKGD